MEMMRQPDPAQGADGGAQIHMIAGDQQPAAPGAESRDRLAILGREPIPDIDREQPELVELRTVEGGENRIRLARRIAIARGDVIERRPSPSARFAR